MSGKQRAVLWIGLLIIGLNLVSKWSEIKGVIFTGPKTTTPSGGGNSGLPGFSLLPPGLIAAGNAATTPTNNKVTPV